MGCGPSTALSAARAADQGLAIQTLLLGQPKTSLSIDASWTMPQLEAAYNWMFVSNDRRNGIHNLAYTVGLLKASITHLRAGK